MQGNNAKQERKSDPIIFSCMRPNKNVRAKIFGSTDCRVYQHIIFRLLTLNKVLLVRTLVQNQDPPFHFLSTNTFSSAQMMFKQTKQET